MADRNDYDYGYEDVPVADRNDYDYGYEDVPVAEAEPVPRSPGYQ